MRTDSPQVEGMQTYHATLAEILVRSKHQAGAHKAYQQAIELADRPSVRNWLLQRAAQHRDDKSQA